MPRRSTTPPAYKRHAATGQARVRMHGRDHYLGPYGSKESKQRYAALVADWSIRGGLPDGKPTPTGLPTKSITVVEAIRAYRKFVAKHYLIDGKPSPEVDNIGDAMKTVRKLFGKTPLAEFGPLKYKAVRQAMVDGNLARSTINNRMGRVRRWIKWCVAEELGPADLLYRLQAVPALLPGRDGVREAKPVEPVSAADVEAVLPHVRPPIAAMIRLQLLTGMRPGEVIRLTMGQMDRTGDVWIYRPARHKTAWRGRKRQVFIGPKAQEVLAPWLKADPEAPLFCPKEDHEARMAKLRAARKTKVQPSQKDRSKRNARRRPAASYTVESYTNAIYRGCQLAGLKPVWGPNRLRHSYATACRASFGLEGAQVMLGHSRADVTQIYAEVDASKASEIARKIG
jgi:integrase